MNEVTRESGVVEKFDSKRGFGFITRENNESNIFVHYSEIQGEGYKELNAGQKVTFEAKQTEKGPAAFNVVAE